MKTLIYRCTFGPRKKNFCDLESFYSLEHSRSKKAIKNMRRRSSAIPLLICGNILSPICRKKAKKRTKFEISKKNQTLEIKIKFYLFFHVIFCQYFRVNNCLYYLLGFRHAGAIITIYGFWACSR